MPGVGMNPWIELSVGYLLVCAGLLWVASKVLP
jgi:hypothetical protein